MQEEGKGRTGKLNRDKKKGQGNWIERKWKIKKMQEY